MAILARRRSIVGLALDQVPIAAACRLIGMDIPADLDHGRPPKVRCPFGPVYHSDQGAEPSMRIYPDTDTVHCFSRCGSYNAVTLVAAYWDISRPDAARELLERAGIRPLSMADLWAQASTVDLPPDANFLSEALKTFCARIDPDWAETQFEPGVAAVLTQCLQLLDKVTTDDDAALWLAGCKTVMSRLLAPG